MFGSSQRLQTVDFVVPKSYTAPHLCRNLRIFPKQSKSHFIIECKRWSHLPLLSRIDHEGVWS